MTADRTASRRVFLRRTALAAAGPTLLGAAGPGLPFDDLVARTLAGVRASYRRLPGLAGAIVRGGRLVGLGVEGVRKQGSPAPIRPDDQFHLGSCTKAMTATVAAAVVDSGRLGWDSTLAGTFPDLAGRMHPDYRAVTLDQLLRHRGGMPANISWWGVPPAPSARLQRRTVVATALGGAPAAPPGSKYLYSNLGYVLAGAMAEEAADAPWEELIRRVVFGPLGMASAGLGTPGRDGAVDQPWGHAPLGPLLRPSRVDNPPVMGPAGTVHAALGDWARFASFHLGDGAASGRRLLSRESFAHLHDPGPAGNYAAGWLVTGRHGRAVGPTWEHTGSNTIWFAVILLAPQLGFAALAAINSGGKDAEAAIQALGDALLALEPATRV